MSPINYKRYPSNWKTEIRPRILARAGNKCEQCGVENYATGARDRAGQWHTEHSIENMNSGYGQSLFGDFPRIIKIVLTIAHFDHDLNNNEETNLFAWCQKCHLMHDQPKHQQNARITRNKNKGLQELF
jgi:hypothetical protein